MHIAASVHMQWVARDEAGVALPPVPAGHPPARCQAQKLAGILPGTLQKGRDKKRFKFDCSGEYGSICYL